jgi:hypothetical protein
MTHYYRCKEILNVTHQTFGKPNPCPRLQPAHQRFVGIVFRLDAPKQHAIRVAGTLDNSNRVAPFSADLTWPRPRRKFDDY